MSEVLEYIDENYDSIVDNLENNNVTYAKIVEVLDNGDGEILAPTLALELVDLFEETFSVLAILKENADLIEDKYITHRLINLCGENLELLMKIAEIESKHHGNFHHLLYSKVNGLPVKIQDINFDKKMISI